MAESNAVQNVIIHGAGPYGFRLSGGDGSPMTIIKLRRQGKAHQADLHEGDTVLGINGYSCRTMSHAAAMGLLESAVKSIELLVFRGNAYELNLAYDEVASRLRPLPLGAVPPPRVLPPPPSAESGSLVIDQPSFMRPAAERFVVDERQQENEHANEGVNVGSSGGKVIWQPEKIPHPTTNGPRQPWTSTYEPPAAAAAVESPQHGNWSVGMWQNAPSQTPARWTPHQQTIVDEGENGATTPNFRISSAPSTDPNKPWMWKPAITHQVNLHVAVKEQQDEWQPVPEPQPATPHFDERDNGRHQTQPARNHEGGEEEGVPKWALPLRSDYDWKKSYPWLLNDDMVIAEDDEWEYGYSSDGQMIKRKKKIFSDSSFYDDPNHKYPTIEEQIKMARRVAQSLTAATNVSARGQRMFLRRREKADRWIVSELPPPTMAMLLRRGLVGPVGINQSEGPSHGSHDYDESDAELYYNPAPWMRAGKSGGVNKVVPEPPKTPSSGARLPWKTNFDSSSSVATVLRQPSPSSAYLPGQSLKWKPPGTPYADVEVSHGEVGKDIRIPKLAASGAPAFNVTKELRQMKGKGGKMFAKRRAQAAEEERRDELAETLKDRHLRKVAGNGARDEDWTDAHVMQGAKEAENNGNGWIRDPAAAGQQRLLELIERTRATSPGRYRAQSTTIVEKTTHKDPSAFGNFSAEVKSRGSFRPVKFKAPAGTAGYAPVATFPSAADDLTEGISDF